MSDDKVCSVPNCGRRAIVTDNGHLLCYGHHMQINTAIPFNKLKADPNLETGGY